MNSLERHQSLRWTRKRDFSRAQILIWVNWFLENEIPTNKEQGISALCLSGGASFGYCKASVLGFFQNAYIFGSLDHCGVVKAFLDAGLLPRVITGTSAGGLIAALTCTRTDEELKVLLDPELANKITACEDGFSVWFKRFWQTGARFDSVA